MADRVHSPKTSARATGAHRITVPPHMARGIPKNDDEGIAFAARRLAAAGLEAAQQTDAACGLLVKVLTSMREDSAGQVDSGDVASWVREIDFVVQGLWRAVSEAEDKIASLQATASLEGGDA